MMSFFQNVIEAKQIELCSISSGHETSSYNQNILEGIIKRQKKRQTRFMDVITIQVKEEKVTRTALATYVIVIIQTKKRKQTEINQYSQRSHFLCGHQGLG